MVVTAMHMVGPLVVAVYMLVALATMLVGVDGVATAVTCGAEGAG